MNPQKVLRVLGPQIGEREVEVPHEKSLYAERKSLPDENFNQQNSF